MNTFHPEHFGYVGLVPRKHHSSGLRQRPGSNLPRITRGFRIHGTPPPGHPGPREARATKAMRPGLDDS
jgi:hypothetical protein